MYNKEIKLERPDRYGLDISRKAQLVYWFIDVNYAATNKKTNTKVTEGKWTWRYF